RGCAASYSVFGTVPAEANDTRAGACADDRPRLRDPMFEAVEPLLCPVAERARPLGIGRVQRAGVDFRSWRQLLLYELFDERGGLLAGAHAIDRVDAPIL